jgi:FlaA1/EpsC-like NDP-sugar epimerase
MADREPAEVLIAIPTASPTALRNIVRALEPFRIRITTLPRYRDLLTTHQLTSQVRQLRVEDLLARVPVGLDSESVRHLVGGSRVLVTGAGGSIGSEICRQLLPLKPAALVMLDRYENGLHAISTELSDQQPEQTALKTVLADVSDAARLDDVFLLAKPDIVFHAAAHKHVPLLESNPCEAVKNNVRGSRLTAEAAARHGVRRFIMVSTDKAVNPTSVMGATKRIAELMTTLLARSGSTTFSIVRFGNVLASNGSVVPRFMEQIRKGGPLTVTHPDVRRYFMLIPEAVQLVLHAAALNGQAAIYVLEMGDQLKLVDLARDLIRLSGFIPDVEVPIQFTGLRPGEKLFEELIGDGERAEPSSVHGILKVTPPVTTLTADDISRLEAAAIAGQADRVIALLEELIPGYNSRQLATT